MPLCEEKRQLLLTLARAAIAGRWRPEQPQVPAGVVFQQPAACFVTLKKNGQLRGCIGNLQACGTLAGQVMANARAAAFADSRFQAVQAAELAQLTIEISLLSKPQTVTYRDAEDLRKKLRPSIDGVILRTASHGATFLPQVWQELPDVDVFLDCLCRKAGLAAGYWQYGQPEIAIYQVEHFQEIAPS